MTVSNVFEHNHKWNMSVIEDIEQLYTISYSTSIETSIGLSRTVWQETIYFRFAQI